LFFAPKVPLSRAFQICVKKLIQRTHFNFFPNFLLNVHQKGGSFLIFGVATNQSFNSPFDGWLFYFLSKLGLLSTRAFKLWFSSPLCPILVPQRPKKHVPIRPLFTCFPPILLSNFTTCEFAFLFNCFINEVSTPCTRKPTMGIAHNVFAVGDVALSLEYVRAPYCLLRVMRVF
jgi:hypothetical protein